MLALELPLVASSGADERNHEPGWPGGRLGESGDTLAFHCTRILAPREDSNSTR